MLGLDLRPFNNICGGVGGPEFVSPCYSYAVDMYEPTWVGDPVRELSWRKDRLWLG